VNRSLGVGQIRTAYRRDIPTYHVADAPKPLTKPANRLQRDRYYAFRPPLAKAPEGRSPRVAESPRQGASPPSTPPVVRGGAYGRGRYGAERESQELPRRQAAERKQLEAEQQREMRAPPPGVDQNELRRQHEEEQRALAEQAARDRRVLEGRRQQEQQREQQNPPPEQQRQTKEKGERRAPLPKGSQTDKQDDGKRPDAKRPDKQADKEESRRK
jgi:hypothetical protein